MDWRIEDKEKIDATKSLFILEGRYADPDILLHNGQMLNTVASDAETHYSFEGVNWIHEQDTEEMTAAAEAARKAAYEELEILRMIRIGVFTEEQANEYREKLATRRGEDSDEDVTEETLGTPCAAEAAAMEASIGCVQKTIKHVHFDEWEVAEAENKESIGGSLGMIGWGGSTRKNMHLPIKGVPAELPIPEEDLRACMVRGLLNASFMYEELVQEADYEPVQFNDFYNFKFYDEDDDLYDHLWKCWIDEDINRTYNWEKNASLCKPVALSYWNPRFVQREYVVDSGASYHTVAFNTLSK